MIFYKQNKQYPYQEEGITYHKDYCFLINGHKYNRNKACKVHDNHYGIKGGGTEKDRRKYDLILYQKMKKHKDPMAFLTLVAILIFGWAFFNYHQGIWRGQLIKSIKKWCLSWF